MGRTQVAIADDHPIVREGLKRVINACPDLEVAAEVDHGDEVVSVCASARPDVLLLDVSMPGPGFLEILRQLKEAPDAPAVLVLSVHPEQAFAYRALESGAAGYLNKERPPETLAEAIRTVARGGSYFGSPASTPTSKPGSDWRGLPLESRLSSREFQVFVMLGEGMRVAEIAAKLRISPKTVSTHRARILEKTRFESNAEIVRYVSSSGLRS